MDLHKIVEVATNPTTAAIVGAIIGFIFDVWKTAPSRKILRSIKIIERYAPIIFKAVEEAANVAKKSGDGDAKKIDKVLTYENEMSRVLKLYGGVVTDDLLKIAKNHAQAINNDKKKEEEN